MNARTLGKYKLVKPRDNALVSKHNKLVEARYSLTLQEQRLMLWLVSQIQPDDDVLQGFTISIKELGRFLGIHNNKNLYAEIEAVTSGLVTKLIVVDDFEKNTRLQSTWLAEAEYQYGEGLVDVSINKGLRRYLLGLQGQFTSYSLRIAVSLKSTYSIRMYELLMQYKVAGSREIEIVDLREYLGIKPEQYPKYSMFKKRTLERAQKEINEKTDIYFEFEEIKRGRKIELIKFIIKPNANYGEVVKLPMGDEVGVRLVARLTSHGVKEKAAWNIVHAHLESDPVRISWHIDQLEAKIKDGDALRSPAGWLVKAIDTDHRPQQTLFQKNTAAAKEEAEKKRRKRLDRDQKILRLESEISDLEKDYRLYVGECIEKWKEPLSQDEISTVTAIVTEGMKEFSKTDFKRKPWGSVFNQHYVMRYLEGLGTPLPYQDRETYSKENGRPFVGDLEKKLKALQTKQ